MVITFYTHVPFQCLANEFKLLFMRAFFSVIVVFIFILVTEIVFESSVSSQVNGNAPSSHYSDCNTSFLILKILKET